MIEFLIHLASALIIIASLYCDLSKRFNDSPVLTTARHLLVVSALALSYHAGEIVKYAPEVAATITIFIWAVAVRSMAVARAGMTNQSIEGWQNK